MKFEDADNLTYMPLKLDCHNHTRRREEVLAYTCTPSVTTPRADICKWMLTVLYPIHKF